MGVRRSFITPTGPCTCVLKPSRWPAVDRSELTRQSNWYLKGILCASKTFALQNWIAIVEGLAQKKKKKKVSSCMQSRVSYQYLVVWINPARMFASPSCVEGLQERNGQGSFAVRPLLFPLSGSSDRKNCFLWLLALRSLF